MPEVEHVRTILSGGTSAHRQLAVHEAAKKGGATEEEAAQAVVDHLIKETASGIRTPDPASAKEG